MESQGEAPPDGFDGNQVPDIVAADESGEEVDVGRRVGGEAFGGCPVAGNLEVSPVRIDGGLYLNAPDAVARVQHDVVVLVVAEGLGDGEASAGGLEHEVQFGQIAEVFCGVGPRASSDRR